MKEEIDNKDYAYLIDEVCPPKGKSNKLVRQIIPRLVWLAKAGITIATYMVILMKTYHLFDYGYKL